MTYSSGGLIQAADYNTLAWGSSGGGTYVDSNNLAYVWGTGNGRYGYGQDTSAFTQVSAAATVSATQWTGLLGKVTSAAAHQGTAITTGSSVTAGTVITYLTALQTDITAIKTAAGTANMAGTRSDSAANVATGGSTWATSTVSTHTLTFSSGDTARYFFNAGGQVKFTFSITATGSTRNAEWNDLATKCGTVTFGYRNTTCSGTITPTTILNATNGGYWNLTASDVVHFKAFADTAPYTTNYIQIAAKWSGTASNGGSPVITFTTTWADIYSNPFQENVTQAASTSMVVSSPPTTYLTNTWGTPTPANSTVTT